MGESIAPITYVYRLACGPAHAFDTYTRRIGEWWDARYSANPKTLQSVTIEPRVGGRVYATHRDLGEHDWGEVSVWDPGRRLVHTFTLAQDPEQPSEVAVDFLDGDDEEGCTLRFAHGGWTLENAAVREKFGDWPLLLARFVALAEKR